MPRMLSLVISTPISVSEHIPFGTDKSDGNSSQPGESAQWSIENINNGIPLSRLPNMYGINVPRKYICSGFRYFFFQVEDDKLASVSYLDEGAGNV